jgi:hypothetical protein
LESGDEFFIDAKSNGTLLTLAPGESSGMQLFTGVQSADRGARWTIDDSSDTNSRFDYPQSTHLHFYMK